MGELISALFDRREDAEAAVSRLMEIGVPREAISVVARGGEEHRQGHHGGNQAAKGALTGLGVGAVGGALFGLASLVIPGVGPFIAAGALAEVLGVAGGAAASGAIVGATAGGLAGAISRWGASEADAKRYASEVERGAVFVGVDTARSPVSPEVIVEALQRSNGRVERAARAGQPGPTAAAVPVGHQLGGANASHQGILGRAAAALPDDRSTEQREARVPLAEEVAQVRKVQHEAGQFGLAKHVDVETRHISEPVIRTRLETEVREIPAGEAYEAGPQSVDLRPGETLRIAVYEEELVIQKVPRVTREVLIHARPEVEQVEQDIQLRKERVEVLNDGDTDDYADDPALAAQQTGTRRHP